MYVIRHIVGRTLQVFDPSGWNMTPLGPEELREFDIHIQAEVLLNGKRTKIAALQPGDVVNIGNGHRDGYLFVEAARDPTSGQGGTAPRASMRVLQLSETPSHSADAPPSDTMPATPTQPPTAAPQVEETVDPPSHTPPETAPVTDTPAPEAARPRRR